jgi:uncharacterized FAD-dependent dehydrogenase
MRKHQKTSVATSLLFSLITANYSAAGYVTPKSAWHAGFGSWGSTARARRRPAGLSATKPPTTSPGSRDAAEKSPLSVPSSKRKRPNRPQRCSSKPPNQRLDVPQTWRLFGVEVHPDDLPPVTIRNWNRPNSEAIDQLFLHDAVVRALEQRLRILPVDGVRNISSPIGAVRVVRRSLDARHKRRTDGTVGPRFVYVLDVDLVPLTNTDGGNPIGASLRLKHQPGRMELLTVHPNQQQQAPTPASAPQSPFASRRVIVVGAGPAGLFCALALARQGFRPILLERGQAVESRGKDIGALMHRRSMNGESNFAFGEGGAGTWSDGKLTTRIGRNSQAVRDVLDTLVAYGAPQTILVEGAPHLGTDNLVRLLRNMRLDLRALGGKVRFGTRMTSLIVEDGIAVGVEYHRSQPAVERNVAHAEHDQQLPERGSIRGDAVVLATGHSARDVYENLYALGVQLEPKGFAVGFRVEHPQALINKIQYGSEWAPSVITGKSTTDATNAEFFASQPKKLNTTHPGQLPVPSYRLATDQAYDGNQTRGVYSFCMCPGGQIVPASTDPDEVCVNGMSFSRRDSLWANSALVVTVAPDDPVLDEYRARHGVLSGIAFQRDMERKAATMGGGNLTVPVQRLTDFVAGIPSTTAPSSSYRLGVRPAACHELYPAPLTTALRHAVMEQFERQMPGFVSEEGLLHAVETRTSSPVRVSRNETTMQALGIRGLYPAGEGAGFAGGIVSAAVDGLAVAEAILEASLSGSDAVAPEDENRKERAKAMKTIGTYY